MVELRKAKAIHKARAEDYGIWKATKDGCKKLIRAAVEEVYINELKDGTTFFLELYIKSVFSGWYWSVFLGIYHTDTKGNLGRYISVSFFWREPLFPSKRGQWPPF